MTESIKTKSPNSCVIQFAKLPQLNRVKTRMQPYLTPEQSLMLHERLVAHTYKSLSKPNRWDYQLWVSAQGDETDFFADLTSDVAVSHPIKIQNGSDLGQRMHHALAAVLENYRYAVIVGSDCPALDAAAIDRLLSHLKGGCSAALIPARDGGYVALALSEVCPALFDGVAWGSDTVLEQTCQRLQRLNWQYRLEEAMPDIDRPEDLSHIRHYDWGDSFKP